ncbi:MAG: hypothetical protein E7257_11310 [Lachnospiraceae bacterium]|nr:hypothetical protein [Lachnospiraceae bacterium]
MDVKTKKILSAVATVVLFIGLGIYYLLAPGSDGDNTATTQATTEKTTTEVSTVENDDQAQNDPETEQVTEAEPTTEVEIVTYEFRKQQYLDEHFEKHGSEFDYETAEEYLAGANRVINDPNSLYKTEAEDGDHIYYLESTNEFVVLATDGYIRTYFKPSAGIDYFNRQ